MHIAVVARFLQRFLAQEVVQRLLRQDDRRSAAVDPPIAKLKETQLELDQLIFLKSSDSSHPWVRRQWQGQRHCTWQT